MPRLFFDQAAKADLRELAAYIAFDQHRPEAARKLAARIQRDCDRYAQNSLMGQQRDDLFPGLRQFTVRPYVVFYVPIENGIRVLRIIHGARDFPALFS
jgi:toxin ParE1/3/4